MNIPLVDSLNQLARMFLDSAVNYREYILITSRFDQIKETCEDLDNWVSHDNDQYKNVSKTREFLQLFSLHEKLMLLHFNR